MLTEFTSKSALSCSINIIPTIISIILQSGGLIITPDPRRKYLLLRFEHLKNALHLSLHLSEEFISLLLSFTILLVVGLKNSVRLCRCLICPLKPCNYGFLLLLLFLILFIISVGHINIMPSKGLSYPMQQT